MNIGNKQSRKRFFISLGTITAGFLALGSIPFNWNKISNFVKGRRIQVKINPLAVSRKEVGKKNV